jgi:hypothetical protein
MTDDAMQPSGKDRPERAKPEQVDQREQQSPAGATVQPGQRTAPGRRPLFRT